MSTSGEKSRQKRLNNLLDEDHPQKKERQPETRQDTVNIRKKTREHVDLDERPLPEEDVIDKIMRGGVALFFAVFSTAVAAGIIEANPAWDAQIEFASWPMIGATALCYYPFYKILFWMGFFRRKKNAK